MNRRSVAALAALSIAAAALAAASVAYRVLAAEAEGRREASTDFDLLVARLAGLRSSADLAGARPSLVSHYKSSPRLLLVSVYERGAGIRWRMPERSAYLPAAENQKPFPEPVYPYRSSVLLSAPLAGDVTGRLAVDALYATIDQSTVFVAFRDALIGLGAYLALAAALLAIAAAAARRASRPSRAAAPRAEPEPRDEPAHIDRPAASPSPAPLEEEFEIPEMLPDADVPAAAASAPAAGSAAAPAPAAEGAGLYSPLSGLGWESYLADRLDAELARSASFEQDLSILFVDYDDSSRGSQSYGTFAKAVRDFFTFKDLAFERGDRGFSVILTNIDIDSALRMAEEFLKKLTFLLRDYRDPLESLPIFLGLSSRAGRLVDSQRISQEASAALQKARDDCDTHIVAFRPDPDKYRLYLASKGC